MGGEVERCEAPGESVVEVVHEPGLAAGAQDRVAQARVHESAAKVPVLGLADVVPLLERDLRSGVTHGKRTDEQTGDGDHRGADPDDGAWRVAGGERAGGERGRGDAEVPGGLVEAEREPAATRADEVDLHHHGH